MYLDILADLSEKWLMIEINHKVSKEATNLFWKLGKTMFHALHEARRNRKIPQFPHLREKLYKTKVPPVKMEIGYQSKEDGQLTVLKDVVSVPVSQYPPSSFKRLYEIASVDVSIYNSFLRVKLLLYY